MNQKIALVLSSGGARGIAHIGVIEELEEQGFIISSLSGSSIGAVIGGIRAMDKLKTFADWMCSLTRVDVLTLMDFTISSSGLMKAEKVFKKIESVIPDVPIEEMGIPFIAMATDIVSRKEVSFTQGSFYKAVRASIAIPTIITTVQEKNKILVDGGVLNPIPLNQIKRTKNDILVVVNLYEYENIEIEESAKEEVEKPNSPKGFFGAFSSSQSIKKKIVDFFPSSDKKGLGYISLLDSTITLMTQRIAALSIEQHKPDIVITIPHNSAGTFDFHKSKQLIELGRKAAKKSIEEWKTKNAINS